jgi:catechol 2,3-dioxygenase-like lactoylglutathione lyase family enzyme
VEGAFFGVSVADLEASTRWYTEKLGLSVVSRFPPSATTSGVLLAGGGLEVELITNASAASQRNHLDSAGLDHGFFKVGVRVADFDRTIAELRQRGVPVVIGPFPPRRDQRANAIIRDDAGNLIQFFGDYAR